MKTILVDAVNTFIVDGQVNQELYTLLESYPHKKIIVTNANDEQMITLGVVNAPYEVFTLKHHPDKIDPQYFELLMDTFTLSSADILYIEHNPQAVISAESVGITSYHYHSQEEDLQAVKLFLDFNLYDNKHGR